MLSRRWEGTEGRDECGSRENSRCKGPNGRKLYVVEKPRQAHLPRAQTASEGLHNIKGQGECEDAQCPIKQCAHRRVG